MTSIDLIKEKLKPLSTDSIDVINEWILDNIVEEISSDPQICQLCYDFLRKKDKLVSITNEKTNKIIKPICDDCVKLIFINNFITKHLP